MSPTSYQAAPPRIEVPLTSPSTWGNLCHGAAEASSPRGSNVADGSGDGAARGEQRDDGSGGRGQGSDHGTRDAGKFR